MGSSRLLALMALAAGGGFKHPPLVHAVSYDEPEFSCDAADMVHACIMSDRPEMMLAVMKSAHASASPRTCIKWELFTTAQQHIEQMMQSESLKGMPRRHSVRITTLLDAEMALEERGITPVWMRPRFRKGASGAPLRTLWSLREPAADSDPKHSHPLNLLRFYLAELPLMQELERVLLFDDDVCIRDDLRELYHGDTIDAPTPAHGPVLVASCQMQQWDGHLGGFHVRVGEYTYADTPFLGTVGGSSGYAVCPNYDEADEDPEDGDCDNAERNRPACAPAALEPKLLQLHSEISGQTTFRNETAWNFGMTLLHLNRWQQSGIGRRFERWFVANEHFAFFAPNSISFGLGLAYLALAGQVQCWPEGTMLDGLGYLTWDDFAASGMSDVDVEVRALLQTACLACPARMA